MKISNSNKNLLLRYPKKSSMQIFLPARSTQLDLSIHNHQLMNYSISISQLMTTSKSIQYFISLYTILVGETI